MNFTDHARTQTMTMSDGRAQEAVFVVMRNVQALGGAVWVRRAAPASDSRKKLIRNFDRYMKLAEANTRRLTGRSSL
ncbi:MAG: hypothetical protein JNK35_11010 [Phycisphaerae bacterium]|nr:hypothetical protein [Phycisphaerae bacterium]